MSSVLFVCTGNICRSPMAEGLLRSVLRSQGIDDIEVRSAGTSGLDGWPASAEAVDAMAEIGIDISEHVARRLDRRLIEGSDLILGMTGEHREAVTRLDPTAAGRTFTLSELVNLAQGLDRDPGGPAGDRMAVTVAGARRLREAGAAPEGEDVPDPIGYGLGTYRSLALQLGTMVLQLAEGLFGEAAAMGPAGSSVGARGGHEGDGFE